ncbi:MAG: hypothetical protein WEE50_08605, partial [Chloroflexota bacterium]
MPPVAIDSQGDRSSRGKRRAGNNAPRVGAGAEGGPRRDAPRHDHRGDRARGPNGDADAQGRQEKQREVRRDRARHTQSDNKPQANPKGQPGSEAGGEEGADRGKHAHAEDRNGRQQACRAGGQLQVVADERQQRPDGEELRTQR